MMTERLREETGTEPDFIEIEAALEVQLEDPQHNSDFTPYHRWNQNPLWPASRVPTSFNNPVDLTESSPIITNTLTKKHETDLRQTNATSVKSSQSLSVPSKFLSSFCRSDQGSILKQTQPQPRKLLPYPQTSLTTQMPEVGRRKVKAVPKGTATSTPISRDVGPATEASAKSAANTATQASSQPLMTKHTEKFSNAGHPMQSKSSPPPASTRIEYNLSLIHI